MIDKKQAQKHGIQIIDSTKSPNALFKILQTQFPQTIKDGQVSLKSIATLLGLSSSDMQGYELTFTGKGLANALYTTPCNKVLRLKEVFNSSLRVSEANAAIHTDICHTEGASATEVSQKSTNRDISLATQTQYDKNIDCHESAGADSRNDNEKSPSLARGDSTKNSPSLAEGDKGGGLESKNPKNTIIIGDNIDALKILKSAYSQKIKMIYIDPPYNTTSDNFIYPDNFRDDYKAILREVGLLEIDENGKEVESENLKFFKNITSSKTHSGWLSFMLPRLKLARDLLKDDGVIFISIDDNECANLKILCDEIFGEDNFVSCLVWKSKSGGANDTKNIVIDQEYILCYAKNIDNLKLSSVEYNDENLKLYNCKDEFFNERGPYRKMLLMQKGLSFSQSLTYKITAPDGTILQPDVKSKAIWRWSEYKFKQGLKNKFIEFEKDKNGQWRVYTKQYLNMDYEGNLIERKSNLRSVIDNIDGRL